MLYLVTGGSRGIGAEVVRQAVREGHDVAFTYLGSEPKALAVQAEAAALRAGSRVKAYRMDVRSAAEVERVGEQIQTDLGDPEVVVNNAAINRDNLVVSMSDEEWHDVLATNLHGPFYVCRFFLTGMLVNRFGRIINVSSVSAAGASGQANYAAAKAGITGLTKTLAKEYGPKGITANVVIPGFFDTEMTRESMTDKFRDFWAAYCPIRRIGNVSEIAGVITFLASPAASYVNGAEISVTGGLDHAA
jgi:NAD(P)-dependent dehydrogenase (short-subunit alcohol dehydrogenase family)